MLLPVRDQLRWMEESVNSSALYRHLSARAAHYDALFFAPYLFGTTFWGSLIAPERSCLIPCLHNEAYAYLDIVGSMFRQVRGCLFNARAEEDLARSLYGNLCGGEVGMGFEPIPPAEISRLAPYFSDGAPYILYIGRKETGKDVQTLIDYFVAAKEGGVLPPNIKLVIAGGGSFDDLHRPHVKTRSDVVDVQHVNEEDKRRLIRYSRFLCQPSVNESFSIVLMEAWLLGVPVLVNGKCLVTREHVIESGGGLYFSSPEDFGGAARELLTSPELCATMGVAGKRYVGNRYSWSRVLARFDDVMGKIFLAGDRGGPRASRI
jgi:glycosyltransferase involved in cell wall biosynthesis